jgi:hypothetical protein
LVLILEEYVESTLQYQLQEILHCYQTPLECTSLFLVCSVNSLIGCLFWNSLFYTIIFLLLLILFIFFTFFLIVLFLAIYFLVPLLQKLNTFIDVLLQQLKPLIEMVDTLYLPVIKFVDPAPGDYPCLLGVVDGRFIDTR